MRQLNEEWWEKDSREAPEGPVEFAGVPSPNVDGVFAQAVEEEELSEAITPEESGQGEESYGGEACFRELDDCVEGNDHGVVSRRWRVPDGDGGEDGDDEGEEYEEEVGYEFSG